MVERKKERASESMTRYEWVEHRTKYKTLQVLRQQASDCSGNTLTKTTTQTLNYQARKSRENELEMPLIAATCMSWHNLDDECIIACKPFLMNEKNEWKIY